MKAPFKQVRWLLIKPCMEVFWKWCPTVNQVSFRSQSDINLYYNTTTGWRGFFLSRDGLLSNWITSSRSSTTWSSECDNTQLPLFFFPTLFQLCYCQSRVTCCCIPQRSIDGVRVKLTFQSMRHFFSDRLLSTVIAPVILRYEEPVFFSNFFYFDFSSSRSAKESCSILIWERWNWR